MQLTIQQRVFVVTKYLETKSYQAVIAAFREAHPERDPPTKMNIYRNVRKYLTEGTSKNVNKGRSGRPRTQRNVENIETVRQHLLNEPTLSTRRNGTNFSQTTFHRIVKHDIKWHPYRIHVRHELKNQDFARRLRFCNWFLERCQNNRFLYNLVIGDEAGFSMNGKVNTHNLRCYAPKGDNPGFNYDVNSERRKLTVWAGLCGNGQLVGPFFFDGNVNGRTYLEMLNEYILPALLEAYQNNLNQVWWAQDGAPAHRTRAVRNCLGQSFRGKVIALGHEIEWPARSPDLTPLDFFYGVI